MSITAGRAVFRMAFQLSPIVLVGGIAQNIPGQMLPIIAITEALNFVDGLLSNGGDVNLDNFFANFQPVQGSTLVANQIGTYPFANQAVAANALIAQPLTLSMLMICPARNDFGWATKLATMMALQNALKQHNASGGTYIVITPSFIYRNLIMTQMTDVSNPGSHQAQNAWQLDFVAPLLTLEEAEAAQNSLMSKISSGTQLTGAPTWSGLGPTVSETGANAVGAPAIIPSAGVTPASGISPLIPVTQSPL